MNKKKKFLGVVLAFFILVGCMPIIAGAETGTKYGDYLYYEVNAEGTEVTITDCEIFASEIIVPNEIEGLPVTSIGSSAFEGCSSLTSVSIPDGVKQINNQAFSGCGSLVSIIIPDSVTYIYSGVFVDTTYYNDTKNWENGVLYIGNHLIKAKSSEINGEYQIKDGTKTIAYSAFYDCINLTSVTIPDSITSIGNSVFSGCKSLTSINVSENNQNYCSVDGNLFNKDKTKFIQYAIGKTDTYYEIPNSVTSIGSSAFKGCKVLTDITIPDSVTLVGWYAFDDTAYYYNSNNWENGVLYIGNHLVSSKNSGSGIYKIKDGTKTIASGAFCNCKRLIAITIPNSVISIGDNAFSYCEYLDSVKMPEGDIYIGPYAFNGTAYYNKSKWEDGALYIGNHLIKAESSEINGEYQIKDGTKTIADSAFDTCSNLKSLKIPNSITHIGNNAFKGCNSLTDVYYGGSEQDRAQINILNNNTKLTNATWHYTGSGSATPTQTPAPTDAPTPTAKPTPKSTPTPIPIVPTITAEITRNTSAETDDKYAFDIAPTAETIPENCFVYAAVYDENGVLLRIDSVPLETDGTTTVTVDKSDKATTAKVFVWAKTMQAIVETPQEFDLKAGK